jgi:hypothetical protein
LLIICIDSYTRRVFPNFESEFKTGFQFNPHQNLKRTAAKVLPAGGGGLGLFGQNVGLFGQMAEKCKKKQPE